VSAINAAIGAESAFTLQCKSLVKDYVPQIIDVINKMPFYQGRNFLRRFLAGQTSGWLLSACRLAATGSALLPL